jgi:hypothetical protein
MLGEVLRDEGAKRTLIERLREYSDADERWRDVMPYMPHSIDLEE